MSMYTIWKFELPLMGDSAFTLPVGTQVLTVQEQQGKLQMWVLLDRQETTFCNRVFHVCGTGHPIFDTQTLVYICTVQLNSGHLVLHVFERKETT